MRKGAGGGPVVLEVDLKTARESIANFLRILARSSGNPLFMLIQDFVNSLLADIKGDLRPGADFLAEEFAAHERILEALRARDSELAATQMHAHVCEVESSLEKLPRQREQALKRTTESGSYHDFSNDGAAE